MATIINNDQLGPEVARRDEDNTFDGNITITGDLTIQGTQTTINTTNVVVEDNVMILNSAYTGAPTTAIIGIEAERGTAPNALLVWNEAEGDWSISKDGGLTYAPLLDEDTFEQKVSNGDVALNAGDITGNAGDLDATLVGGNLDNATIDNDSINSMPTITVQGSGGLTGTGSFVTNQSFNETVTISHADTSALAAGSYGNAANGTKIDTITVDEMGHVTAVVTGPVGDIQGVTAGTGLTGGGTAGSVTLNIGAGTGITVNANDVAHADTSTLSGVYGNAADGTKIDSITVDAMGHVTAVATGTTGDIQGVTAGTNLSGGGTSGTVTINHSNSALAAGTYGSTAIGTKINQITTDARGHITAITTGATGDVQGVTAGNGLTGGGSSGTVTLNVGAGTGIDVQADTISVEPDLRDLTYVGNNAGEYFFFDNTNTMIRGYCNSAERFRLTSNGTLHADNNIIAYSSTISDERLKEGIETVQNPLDILSGLRGVTYTRKKDGAKSAGVIAQEVEKVFPSAVTESELPLATGDEETKYKTVEYDQIHAVLIEAIKQQQKTIENMQQRLDALEK